MSLIKPEVGLAYSPTTLEIAKNKLCEIDFIEIPFELIREEKQQEFLNKQCLNSKLFLHCSSLSLASSTRPSNSIFDSIISLTEQFQCKWLSEHIAYSNEWSAEKKDYVSSGFTVSPPLNMLNVNILAKNISVAESILPVPIIVENPPIYFVYPTDELNYIEFYKRFVEEIQCDLLLDITHLLITSKNLGLKLDEVMDVIPLHRIKEIHLSGMKNLDGLWVDSHDTLVSKECLAIFSELCTAPNLEAVTLEYNWISSLSAKQISEQVSKIRDKL